MTRLLLLRHGETVWNRERIVQGISDEVGLNELGIKQAELLARRLREEEGIKYLYSSPLLRARETAQKIEDILGLPCNLHPGLQEIALGDWEGQPFDELKKQVPDLITSWLTNPGKTRVPNGENMEKFYQRIVGAMKDIAASHPQGTVAVVSHGGAISVYISHVLGLDPNNIWRMKIDNTSINEVIYSDGSLRLWRLNDTYHLRPLNGHK